MKEQKPVRNPSAAEHFIREKLKRELSPKLAYHGWHHTEDVLAAAMQIADAEGIPENDKQLLRTAVLFHDSGFIATYKNHEEKSCELAKEILPSFGYSGDDITCICGMIAATKIPQQPQNKLEQIICDADLDYLGRDDFDSIGKTLFEELKNFSVISSERDWDNLQVRFLESHAYHTKYSKQNRALQKQKHIEVLKEKYK